MVEQELKLLGLNELDVKVYLALLELGESLASDIAKKSNIPRTSIYDILERLEKEGLVSFIVKDYKKYFFSADPKTIIETLDYKKNKIKEILPELEKIKKKPKLEVVKSEVYEGMKGLQTILNMVLDEKEMFVLGASRKSSDVLPYFLPQWMKQRIKKKIKVNIIYNDTLEIRKSVKDNSKYLGTSQGWNAKFLSVDNHTPLMTIVFGNKTALIMWRKDNPSAILMTNSEVAETYKGYIMNLWKIAKK